MSLALVFKKEINQNYLYNLNKESYCYLNNYESNQFEYKKKAKIIINFKPI